MAARPHRRRLSLLAQFNVLSLLCLLALGFALGRLLEHQIRERALASAGRSAALLADVGFRPALRRSDFRAGKMVDRDRWEALEAVVQRGRREGRVLRVKVWNRQGSVVYSDDFATIGRRFAVEDELGDALRGRIHSEVTDAGERDEHADVAGLGRLVETYAPLRMADGEAPSGAFEIYLPYAPTAAAVRHDTRMAWALLAAGLGLLWVALFRIVAGASRRLRHQAAESRELALHDPLTGLPNRRRLFDALEETLERAREGELDAALMVVDLDDFKELNDTLGHQAGDRLLAQLGPRLEAALPHVELLARLGGDEFAIILPAGAGPEAGPEGARAVLAALEEPFDVEGLHLVVAASVGIACFPGDGADAETLLRRADVAMYEAKRGHRGWAAYDPGRDRHSPERLALAGELRQAIAQDQLVLHYQPKADLISGDVYGVEALVRWQHPTRGLLGPDDFLPVAEQAGLMRPLTLWVIEHALRQCHDWRRSRLELRVAVNLSAANLLDAGLPDDVAAALRRFGLEPWALQLEITENVVMVDPQRVSEVLRRLADLGVGLSLDDFGTGYSSLVHLRQLAVDELKIDRSFVRRMVQEIDDARIVRSTVDLGRSLGLRVVAEGVEDPDTWRVLRGFGCDEAQGFLLARPVPPLELSVWLIKRRLSLPEPVAAVAV